MYDSSAAIPFTGYVVNINCRTNAHSDPGDKAVCVVIPIGLWDGGELVLDELGLVLDLKQGHAIVFKSQYITHYNLDYKGKRISVVLQSDARIDGAYDRHEEYYHAGLMAHVPGVGGRKVGPQAMGSLYDFRRSPEDREDGNNTTEGTEGLRGECSDMDEVDEEYEVEEVDVEHM
jgi:hypothetical protein